MHKRPKKPEPLNNGIKIQVCGLNLWKWTSCCLLSLHAEVNSQAVTLEIPFKIRSAWNEEIIFLLIRQQCFFKTSIHAVQRKQFPLATKLYMNSRKKVGNGARRTCSESTYTMRAPFPQGRASGFATCCSCRAVFQMGRRVWLRHKHQRTTA